MRLSAQPVTPIRQSVKRIAGESARVRLFASRVRDDARGADTFGAEHLATFVSRFGRLKDTVGHKFIPALLLALAKPVDAATAATPFYYLKFFH